MHSQLVAQYLGMTASCWRLTGLDLKAVFILIISYLTVSLMCLCLDSFTIFRWLDKIINDKCLAFLRSFELKTSLRKTSSFSLLTRQMYCIVPVLLLRAIIWEMRRYETRGFFLIKQFHGFVKFLQDFVRQKLLN